jgi:hypothetical protein
MEENDRPSLCAAHLVLRKDHRLLTRLHSSVLPLLVRFSTFTGTRMSTCDFT